MAFGDQPTIWTLRGNKESYVEVFDAETTHQSRRFHPPTTPTLKDSLMKHTNTLPTSVMAALLGLGLTAAGQAAHANQVTPPSVPDQT